MEYITVDKSEDVEFLSEEEDGVLRTELSESYKKFIKHIAKKKLVSDMSKGSGTGGTTPSADKITEEQIDEEYNSIMAAGIDLENQKKFITYLSIKKPDDNYLYIGKPKEYGDRSIFIFEPANNKIKEKRYHILLPMYRDTGNVKFGAPINLVVNVDPSSSDSFAAVQIFWLQKEWEIENEKAYGLTILCGERQYAEKIIGPLKSVYQGRAINVIIMADYGQKTSLHGAVADLAKGGLFDSVRIDYIIKKSCVPEDNEESLIKESFRAETECTGCAILDSILAPIGFREREGSTVLDAGKFYNFRKSIIPTILREPNDGADAGNFSLENREKDKAIFDYLLRSYALFHLVGRLDIDEEEYGRRGRQLNGYNIDLLDNPEKQEAFLEKIKKGTLTIGDAILGFLTAVELEKLIEDPGNEVGVNALAGFKNYGNGKDTIICYDSNNLSDESVASRFAELKVGEKASFVFNIGQSHFVAARVLHLENNKFIVLHRDALSSNVGLNLKNFIKNNLNFFDRTIEVSLYNIKNKPGFITQNGGMGSVTCGLHAITVLADGGLMDRLEKSIKSTGIAPLEEGEFIEKVDN